MSGVPIQIRRTNSEMPIDTPSTGEPFLHMEDNKFGIFNGTQMLWYPCIDPLNQRMLMNMNQALSGYDSTGGCSVYISFDTPNAITFKSSAGAVLAQFDSTGASFNNLATLDPLGGGALNRLTHPGFLPNLFSSTPYRLNAAGKKWLGPNTLLYMSAGGMGDVTVFQTYMAGSGNVTHPVSEGYCLQANVASTLGSAGIRFFVMDPNTGYFSDNTKNKNRIFVSIKGDLGKTCYLRVGRNGTYQFKTVVGSGSWKREYIDLPQHSYLSDFIQGGTNAPYAVDVLYNADPGMWGVSEPTMQCIDTFSDEIYQYKSLAERMNMANSLWYEPVGYRMYGQELEYINLPIPMPIYTEGYCMYSVETVFSTYPLLITNKTRKGFEVRTPTDNTSYWKYQPKIIVHGQLSDIA